MSDKARTSLLSLSIIVVLVFSAVCPITVYADDGKTPEAPAAETSSEGKTSTEEAPAEATTDSQPPKDAAPAEGSAEPQITETSTVLSDVPENTAVTVLDEKGEAQPLATQEAAEAISTSDPIWCPGSQPPESTGCTEPFPSFDQLLTFLSENPTFQGAGTIYVEQGTYMGDDPNNVIDFNSPSYNLSGINNANLTVTGGWDPVANTISANNPSTFTDYSILIGSSANPWGGSVTINNLSLVFSGVPSWEDDVNGLTIHSDESINISNVSVTAASGLGAELDAGDEIFDNVNIRDSSFQQNLRGGALVRAGGNVNIRDSSFGNPFPDMDRWQTFGLDVESGDATSLFGVMANMNREAGVTINANGMVTIGSSFFNGTKEMFDENGETVFRGYGLQVVTQDTIAIDDVEGNDNFLWGASLDAVGDISISNSFFNSNTTEDPGFIDDTGLFILGAENVNLENVEANDNRLYGAQINADGAVSISDSFFNNNRGEIIGADGATNYHGQGLQITSADIFIDGTEALNNSLFGAELTATGQVAISDSTFSNTSTGSDDAALGVGLDITSGGNTSLASVTLNANQTVGANIQAGGDIFLDLVTATNNGTNGVVAQGDCARLMGGLYSGNGEYGLYLNNTPLAIDSAFPPVFFNNGIDNIFPETPVLCPVPATNNSAGLAAFTAGTSSFAANVDLNTFMANSRVGTSAHGLFIGKYAYVHSDAGLQVIALQPASGDTLAVAE